MAPFPRWADLHPELLCHIGDRFDDLRSYASARAACTSWRRAIAPPSPTLLVLGAAAATAAPDDDDEARSNLHTFAASLRLRPPRRSIDLDAEASAAAPSNRRPLYAAYLRRTQRRSSGLADDDDDADDAHLYRRPYAASLTTRRSFKLPAIASGARCVGARSDGWLALSVIVSLHHAEFVLVHPVGAGAEIRLPPLAYESLWPVSKITKVVFAPRPARDDFTAAAICGEGTVAYVTAGAARWAVVGPVRGLAGGDVLVDVVYAEEGHKVYCLTKNGDVHVLHLPKRRRRQPAANVGVPEFSLLRPPPQPADEGTINFRPLRCQHEQLNFLTKKYQQCRTRDQDPTIPTFCAYKFVRTGDQDPAIPTFCAYKFAQFRSNETVDPPVSQEPDHLNEPATIEPLLSEANLPFNPATAFASPYDTVSRYTSAKNLVVCEGNLYQVWRNESCTVTLNLPAGGGQRRVTEHEVLVLRYYPEKRQPCWDVVKDLGGHSFFVGRNNAVSMYAKGVPGLKGNCVYWIGGHGRDQGMVFDMEYGRSSPCGAGFLPRPRHSHSTICWYFLNDACKEHQQQLQQ